MCVRLCRSVCCFACQTRPRRHCRGGSLNSVRCAAAPRLLYKTLPIPERKMRFAKHGSDCCVRASAHMTRVCVEVVWKGAVVWQLHTTKFMQNTTSGTATVTTASTIAIDALRPNAVRKFRCSGTRSLSVRNEGGF